MNLRTLFKFNWRNIAISAILIAIAIQCVYALLQLHVFPSTGSSFKLTGTFKNPDHLAGYIASGMPLALGLVLFNRPKSFMYSLGIVSLIFSLLILPATMIRGAWIAAFIGSAAVVYFRFRDEPAFQSVLVSKWFKRLVIPTTSVLIITASIGLYQLKPDSVHGRLLIWKITSQMIQDHPITGIGFGRFDVEYNRYQGNYFARGEGTEKEAMLAGNVGHAHNEFLHILAETGIVGFSFVMICLWFILIKVKLDARLPFYSHMVALKGSMMAVLTSSLFAFPLHIAPTLTNFIATIILFLSISHQQLLEKVFSSSNRIIATTSLVLVVGLWIGHQHFANQKLQTQWNRAIGHTVMAEFDDANRIYETLYPKMKQDGKFLFMYGGLLSVQGEYEKANIQLKSAESTYSDPNLFVLLGTNYESLGDHQKAISYFRTSWHIIPHKFYPLYRMMQTYHRSGNFEEARRTAQHIVDMPEKVSSPATRQMKSEAADYLNGILTEWPANSSR